MMDAEKRIVTFMGDAGRRTATIIWRNVFDLFEVECTIDDGDCHVVSTNFFKIESEAQEYAERFAFAERMENV